MDNHKKINSLKCFYSGNEGKLMVSLKIKSRVLRQIAEMKSTTICLIDNALELKAR